MSCTGHARASTDPALEKYPHLAKTVEAGFCMWCGHEKKSQHQTFFFINSAESLYKSRYKVPSIVCTDMMHCKDTNTNLKIVYIRELTQDEVNKKT